MPGVPWRRWQKPQRMTDPQNTSSRRLLMLAVLVGGITTLAVELSAARLLGATFGASNIVWANIIGLILVYLAAGYFIGGYLADRSPTLRRFYQIVIWGGFTSGLAPFLARLVLPVAAGSGLSLGLATALTIFLLFTIPITLLGCISPFAIRVVLTNVREGGTVAGRIYAVSTVGSAIGSLAPVLILLPAAGTTATFLIFSLLLLVLALWSLAQSDRRVAFRLAWMPMILLLLWMLS
jgi:predicted membrane-bound spermidine synthase